MQPSSVPRPVMDVTAPRPVASAQSVPSQAEMPVKPLLSSLPSTAEPQPSARPTGEPAQTKAIKPQSSSQPKAPIGVIVVALIVMMLLGVLAVIVYVTSQTA